MQGRKKKIIPALAALLCAVILISALPAGALAQAGRQAISSSSRYQGQIDDINSRMRNLDEERRALENSIVGARDQIQQETLRRDSIDQQVRITRDELALLAERIDLLERDIERQIEEIAEKQAEIDVNHALFLARTRAMFVQDDTSTLGLVLGADSFASFLSRTNSMVRIAEHDRRVSENLMAQRLELEEAKAALNTRLEEVESDRALVDERRRVYNSQLAQANARIQDLDRMEREFNANLAQNRAQREQMEREMQELIRRLEMSRNPYVGGEMAWPVPGFFRITSEFGPRFGGSDFHTGLDISGPGIHGATVVAANSGTVRFTNWSHTPGRGYGIFVIIDHGGGISTLYAHLSYITVSVGDEVSIGDPIGRVGSTGWSTGPHLHFEVRHDGRAVNPRPYIIGRRP